MLFHFDLVEQVEFALFDIVFALGELFLEKVDQLVEKHDEIGRGRSCNHQMELIPRHVQLDVGLGEFT